jgi:hypothetical protein
VKEGGWINSGRINSGYLDGKRESGWTGGERINRV